MEKCLDRLKQYLSDHGVTYEAGHHREVYTMQEVAAEIGEKGRYVAKVFVASADGNPLMLVLAAPDHVEYERVRLFLGAEHVERGREEQFTTLFPDCEVGAMPPFGNLYGVPVCLDRALAEMSHITFQAGSHRDTITMTTADYVRIVRPKITRFAISIEPVEPAMK
ncbi:MAG: YbaK/EbsC family protein [Chloroflexi bacterium]|nr:YbaK/EbsC family protein [Chloroflexota bacterium]MCL5274827.1 YbaK/EbsC family protein [Chloroflexota bacterium]